MSLTIALVAILLIAALAAAVGYRKAELARGAGRLHSLPAYHGANAALWVAIPALLLLAVWAPVQTGLVDQTVLASPEGRALPDFDMQRDSILSEAREIAHGQREAGFNPESTAIARRISVAENQYSLVGGGVAILLALGAAFFALRKVGVTFRARTNVERWLLGLLVAASLIAILTTLGIVLSLLFETLRFFSMVSPTEFLFGTSWSPQTAIRADQVGSSGAFGSVPLFWGTVFIGAIIAMIVAIPLGLMSAIFLTQYAPAQLRAWLKPILEILAGVPTVVYGYFAALTVAPAVRDLGLAIGLSSASSTPPTTPGKAAGTSTFLIVSDVVAPIARLPSRIACGTAAIESSAIEETNGMIMIPITRPAASADSEEAPGMPSAAAKSRTAGATVSAAK